MALYGKEREKEAWKLYIAENLRCIGESTAKFSGGPYMTAKWADIVNPTPVETRTPEQVMEHILGRLKEVSVDGRI